MGTRGPEDCITLQVETVTTCNSACNFCPYKDNPGRHGNVMDMDLFKKIADQQAEIPQMGSMLIQGLGEPLLDPFLDERLLYCKKLDIFTGIFTNGFMLTPERADRLIECGLDRLILSLNAINAEQHEKVMGVKGKYEKVVATCNYIIANKPKGFDFAIHTVRNDDVFTITDSLQFMLKWGLTNKGTGYGRIIEEGNWGGLNREAPIKGKYVLGGDKCCKRALNQFYVLWDGTVAACCYDPLGKVVWGNVNDNTIKEIYSNPDYVQFREDHWNNKATRHEICRGCTRI